ncbi:hypothetical protein [Agrococcus sp. DT81.2]|uniref:hypothetical protein n=1 Tax=Agrococcus sp. DT81.2 TaxID=3393414 RepID=UPI003CE54A20
MDRQVSPAVSSAVAVGLAALVALGLSGCGPAGVLDLAASATAQPSSTLPASSPTPSPAAAPAGPAPSPTAEPAADLAPAAPTGSMVPAPGTATDTADGPLEAAALPSEAAELGEPVAFDTGIRVEIVSLEPTEVAAETPGEVSGPALVVSVTASNDSAAPQSVDSAVVTVETADGEVGVGTTAGHPSPFAGVIQPGESVSGRYVFMLDPAAGREVTVSVNYAAGEPVAVFTGTYS